MPLSGVNSKIVDRGLRSVVSHLQVDVVRRLWKAAKRISVMVSDIRDQIPPKLMFYSSVKLL